MTRINEILTLDLQEDIKNVIDLEDRSEQEIQQEIESYIVTEGISRHLYKFAGQFTSNIRETGVWISGFYGSGKSYFGKMLGYIIANPLIHGTPARDRFIPRLKGVTDESIIENTIRNLDSVNSRVVFLDVAKQNTDKGLAFTLFANLLKNLGFRDDIYGYMEFELFLDGKYDNFKAKAKELEGKDWDELKASNRHVAKVMRRVYIATGYSEAEYEDTLKVYSAAVDDFSANKLKAELEKYLKYAPNETLVFIFDEASEAISQKKFTLLDLEGISEALSSISNKVWTIAIAQEKLDDVINNANVNRSQLTKVTDRFKTKIHLESTEVDVIIRSRLLQKKDTFFTQLVDYYQRNEGLVADATNLKSSFPTKTKTAEEFATYYPFHKYQFDVLQKFLFSSNALVATQIAARGMIITTFDVLRKQMRNEELFAFTPGYMICTEAQPAPSIGLVDKYNSSTKILDAQNMEIDGERLLKTIHLLASSAGVVSPTVENITKSYILDITTYYDVKPRIQEALTLLVEEKVLLLSNNNYKITSDLEGKLLEEMRDFEVELFNKKRSLTNYLKEYKLFAPVATFNNGSETFKFHIATDQDDELSSGNKQLKLTVYSLFNISENRQDFIEHTKVDTQHNKELITLVPDNRDFSPIDKLIGEITRYKYMEEKYADESDPEKRKIVREFSTIREEKEKDLRLKIENAYKNASLIYLYDDDLLNADTFKGNINEVQRKLVKNIYTKKLDTQLSENLVAKVFSSRKEDIARLFSGDHFKFFDANGNFVGDHLKVVEEINEKIKGRYADGRTLENDLSGAPWGYSYGTIVVVLAILLRTGKLSVKYNGDTYFSHEQKAVHEAFINATKFKSASFKSVTTTLSATQKNQAVQLLMALEVEDLKVDWNINDFDLADAIRFTADRFIGELDSLNRSVEHFDVLFPNVVAQKAVLQGYSGKVTENNYIEKVEYLLTNADGFQAAITTIVQAQKFIKKNFPKVKEFKRFSEEVVAELKKADRPDVNIRDAHDEFMRLYKQDMVKNFAAMQAQVQQVKDVYFKLIKTAAAGMSHEYQVLAGKVDAAVKQLKKDYPVDLNQHNLSKLELLQRYCADRTIAEPVPELSTKCKNCGYSLSDILNYTALVPQKENELLIIQTGFVAQAPTPVESGNTPPPHKPPRRVTFKVPTKVLTVQEYKSWLTAQLTALAGARPEEEIELDIKNL